MRLSLSLLGAFALAGTNAGPCKPSSSLALSGTTTTTGTVSTSETVATGTVTSQTVSTSAASDVSSWTETGHISEVDTSTTATESLSTIASDDASKTTSQTDSNTSQTSSDKTESISTASWGSTEVDFTTTIESGSGSTSDVKSTETTSGSTAESTSITASDDVSMQSSTDSTAAVDTTGAVSSTNSDVLSATTSATASDSISIEPESTSEVDSTTGSASTSTLTSDVLSDATSLISSDTTDSSDSLSTESTSLISSDTTDSSDSLSTETTSLMSVSTTDVSTTAAETTSSATSSGTIATSDSVSIESSSFFSSSATDVSSATASSTTSSALPVATVDSTILILGKDDYATDSASWGLQGYGIPFEKVLVPKEGFELPALNVSSSKGNYAGIIIVDAVSYEYENGWGSAITTEMWEKIYEYQIHFKVRIVRINEYPGPQFGASTAGDGCCSDGVDQQLISLTDTSDFPSANLKTDAGVSTKGIYHYPATITDPSIAKQIAKFGPGGGYTSDTVAGVINTFEGREQFVWFLGWAHDWSQTTNFLQHAHIHWMTRGVFLGKRKIHLSAQIDDVQLATGLYYPADVEFKIRTGDLDAHITWQHDINGRLPSGSDFWLEFAHNGNGDIIAAVEVPGADDICVPDYAVDYPYPPDTPLEWVKPPGSGEDMWSDEFAYGDYPWSDSCAQLDEFASWFLDQDNLNAFAHLSHTFTHLELNNATYKDASREIDFNRAWMKQMGIDQARRYSTNGLVPPAITGLHNADVIEAWINNKILYVVGDNTRPVLRNTDSKFWPRITNVADNGYDGLVIIPRFATTIYYNCDTAECTTKEWIDTSGGSGDFDDLLAQAKNENTRYLLGLQADPYMFHQANMRQIDMPEITIGEYTDKMSLVTAWVETVAQEMYRLTNWPIISLKHDDTAKYFLDRKAMDDCNPKLSYGFSDDGKTIDHVVVSTDGNSCSVPVPVTVTGGASASGGSSESDTLGSEPTIEWVTLSGSPVTLALSQPVSV